MQDFYVYAHRRNDTGDIFYIGKGRGRRAFNKNGRSELWARIAGKYGFTASIMFSGLTEREAFAKEVELISEIEGLCNHTKGGEGISGYSHTPQTRAKLSEAHKGRKQDPAVVAARTIKLTGQKRSAEFCLAIARRNLERGSPSEETRVKMSASRIGKKYSADHVEKVASWHRGKKRSDSARARMSAGQPKRAVKCIELGQVFESLSAAAEWLKTIGYDRATKTGIWKAARGHCQKAYGLTWRYLVV